METPIHSKIKKYTSAKKPKSKTFKEPWKPWKPNKSFSKSKTRKKQPYNKYGRFYNTLSKSIQNATKDADKHYEKAKVDAFKQINDEKNKAQSKIVDGMKEAQPQLNQLKTDSSHFYNETFGEQKALFAAEISNKGVPQSNPEVVGPNLLATTMHRK